jgi:voltage-gated potassium channel Kch
MREAPTVRTAAGVIVAVTALVMIGGGVAIRVFDHKEYPNVWVGMWWALQTVTTVGYGDVAPHARIGRLIAAVVMLQGVAFIAIITAVITSSFVTRAERDILQQSPDELSDRELIERRFDDLEKKLDRLSPPD